MTDIPEKNMNKVKIDEILHALESNLDDRKNSTGDKSYVASLYEKGLNKILEKVGEEAIEVILAAKDAGKDKQSRSALVNESADLLFHLFVALRHLDIPLSAVFDTLGSRLNKSGHEEKAARN